MAEVSDLQLFGRFFRLCGALSAQEVNYNQVGRDIGVTPQTAKRQLDILRLTFQWIEVPPYSGNTVKRVSGKPKGYLSDTGLLCGSLFLSSPEAVPSHPRWGSIRELMKHRLHFPGNTLCGYTKYFCTEKTKSRVPSPGKKHSPPGLRGSFCRFLQPL